MVQNDDYENYSFFVAVEPAGTNHLHDYKCYNYYQCYRFVTPRMFSIATNNSDHNHNHCCILILAILLMLNVQPQKQLFFKDTHWWYTPKVPLMLHAKGTIPSVTVYHNTINRQKSLMQTTLRNWIKEPYITQRMPIPHCWLCYHQITPHVWWRQTHCFIAFFIFISVLH